MKRKFLLMAATTISSYAFSQKDIAKVQTLDDVIVTANKAEQKQNTTGKVVTVINQETLQRNAGKTLSEILNTQSGFFIVGTNNAQGSNQELYLSGATGGYTLILIDGIAVSDPSYINNGFDLNNINPSQIERIEILKGSQSTLWGSDAVAGVINIITKKAGSKKINVNAMLSAESYNTLKANLGLNGKLDAFTYNVQYNHITSDGFSSAYDSTGNKNYDKDGYKQNNIQAGLGYQFSPKFSVKTLTNYSKYKADVDAGAFTDDKDYTIENSNLLNSVSLHYTNKKVALHLSQSFLNAKRRFVDDSTDIGSFFSKYSRGAYDGNTSTTELYGNFNLTNHFSFVAGVQNIAQNTTQNYMSISGFGPYNTALGDTAKINNFSGYVSFQMLNVHGFNADAGVRVNNHSIYGSNATYSFNPSYNIDENTRVFVNVSTGFKMPTLYQLYSEFGNKKLKPEESNSYEFGVQTFSNNKRNSFRLVGFKRDIKNLIAFYFDATTFQSYYINRDKQNDYGFEAESTIGIGQHGSWLNNISYVDGEGTVDNVKVRNLYRRPNFIFNSTLNLQLIKGLTIAPSFNFVSTRLKGEYDAGPAQLPQYYTVNFATQYEFASHYRAFVHLRNITDQQYFDAVGYNAKRFNWSVGFNFNW